LLSAVPAPVRPVLPSRDLRLQPLAGIPVLQSVRRSVALSGALVAAIRRAATPDGPDDTSDLVGDRDGGLVVHVVLRELVGPLAKPVRLLLARVQQGRARTVDEQRAQVAITALGDPADSDRSSTPAV
jgi:hypothetical protein